jgi:hypothetical protein
MTARQQQINQGLLCRAAIRESDSNQIRRPSDVLHAGPANRAAEDA